MKPSVSGGTDEDAAQTVRNRALATQMLALLAERLGLSILAARRLHQLPLVAAFTVVRCIATKMVVRGNIIRHNAPDPSDIRLPARRNRTSSLLCTIGVAVTIRLVGLEALGGVEADTGAKAGVMRQRHQR